MKSSPYNLPRRPTEGVDVELYSFFNLGARLEGGQRHAAAALAPGKKPSTHRKGEWVDPRASLDGYG